MSVAPRPQVFVSVQATLNPAQARCFEAIRSYLHQLGLSVITMTDWPDTVTDPLPQIRETLRNCQGAVIIAFERFRNVEVIEYPDSPDQRIFAERKTSSVWNQIEAAMAFQIGLPIAVLIEEGVEREGILDEHLTSVRVARFSSAAWGWGKELPGEVREPLDALHVTIAKL